MILKLAKRRGVMVLMFAVLVGTGRAEVAPAAVSLSDADIAGRFQAPMALHPGKDSLLLTLLKAAIGEKIAGDHLVPGEAGPDNTIAAKDNLLDVFRDQPQT